MRGRSTRFQRATYVPSPMMGLSKFDQARGIATTRPFEFDRSNGVSISEDGSCAGARWLSGSGDHHRDGLARRRREGYSWRFRRYNLLLLERLSDHEPDAYGSSAHRLNQPPRLLSSPECPHLAPL